MISVSSHHIPSIFNPFHGEPSSPGRTGTGGTENACGGVVETPVKKRVCESVDDRDENEFLIGYCMRWQMSIMNIF